MTIAVVVVVGLVLMVGLLGPPFLTWRMSRLVEKFERDMAASEAGRPPKVAA